MANYWRILPLIRRLAGAALMAQVFLAPQCRAEAWQQSITARVSEIYDSNPAMSPISQGEVSRTLFEPGYTLLGKLGEDEFKTALAFQVTRSSNPALSPNRNSPNMLLDWSHPIETGEFGVLLKYAEIATLDSGIDATGQTDITSTRTSRYLSGRFTKELSIRSMLEADASYEKIQYSGAVAYVDYITRTENIKFSYAWNDLATPFIKLAHTDYEPITANQSNQTNMGQSIQVDAATIGLTWKMSDNFEGSLQTGKSRSSNGDTSTQSAITVQYSTQRSMLTLNASRLILPSGIGQLITTDQSGVNWNYAINEHSRTGIDFGWRNNHLATDVLNQTTAIWLQTDINDSWGLRTYYQRNSMQREEISNADSNILGITFSYTSSDF